MNAQPTKGKLVNLKHHPAQQAWLSGRKVLAAVTAIGVLGASAAAVASVLPTPPPKPKITAHPARVTRSRTATFKFTDRQQKVVKFACAMGNSKAPLQGWGPCKSPMVIRHLRPGKYRFGVNAFWSTGPVNPSRPATYTWQVR
jgi:hypothetical protein